MNAPAMRDIAEQYPGSVYQSIVDYANWTRKLSVSPLAARLTRLTGPQFRRAVNRTLSGMFDGEPVTGENQ